MRKIIFILIMILGFAVISYGIFMQVDSTNNSSVKENDKEEKTEEKEQESKINRINKFNLETTCKKFDTTTTYINTANFEKITFTYPNCVHEYLLSYWNKMLVNEDESIHLDISIERDKINNYMNETRTSIVAMKNEQNYDVEYSDIIKIKTNDNKNVSILEVNYKTEYIYTKLTYNMLYIAVELEEEKLLTFELKAKDKHIATEVIYNLINNIKVEEEQAIFHDVREEGNYQIGTIRSNKIKSYEHGYVVKYKVPKEYPATPSFTANIDTATFEYEDLYKSLYISMSIETATFLEDIESEIKQSDEISIKNYKEDKTRYRNFETTGILEKEINNKKVYYYIYTYDYYYDNQKSHTGYFSTVLYELEPQMYVKLYMSTKDITIDEKLIGEYLNFTVEEY